MQKAILLTDLFTPEYLIHIKAGSEVEIVQPDKNGYTIIKYIWMEFTYLRKHKKLTHTCKIYSNRLQIIASK
jgi:hypothetical protein